MVREGAGITIIEKQPLEDLTLLECGSEIIIIIIKKPKKLVVREGLGLTSCKGGV